MAFVDPSGAITTLVVRAAPVVAVHATLESAALYVARLLGA